MWFSAFRVIMFDARGTGMSQRDVQEPNLDTLVLDAGAVIAAANLDRFAVYVDLGPVACWTGVMLGIGYGARVTHLVFEAPFVNGSDLADTRVGRAWEALLPLADADWEMYVRSLLQVVSGWDTSEPWAEWMVKRAAAWADPRVGLHYTRLSRSIDLAPILPKINQPTLVLRAEQSPIPSRACQHFAASVSGAHFRQWQDPTAILQAELVRNFILGSPNDRTPKPDPGREASAFRTVLFTDLVGHTEMMSRLGDERGREVLREHEKITREVLKAHGGTEVKTMGDGFMASFGSVTKAVECAVALQRAFAEREGEALSIRVGLNAGEPIEEDGDLFGATVILASRIAARAEGGEILVADTVRGLCSGKGFLFADRGEFVAKGFEEPVRVYEVSWRSSDR